MKVQPDEAAVAQILADRVDRYRMTTGIVTGVVTPTGRRFQTYGRISQARPVLPDEHTVFQTGSVTKVFTALLLSDMANSLGLRLDEAISDLLPGIVGHDITLRHLATHTSGLPPMLPGFATAYTRGAPDYTIDDLLDEFSRWRPSRKPSEQFEYSNVGYALLGTALCRTVGQTFGALMHSRVCQPLGLRDTAVITPLPHTADRCATGHDESLLPLEDTHWGWRVFAGSGTLLTTANDLLTFLSAALGLVQTPLTPAFDLMLRDLRQTNAFYVPGAVMPGNHVGLGWMVHRDEGDIVWHSGGVNGFRAFVGYAPDERTGVAVLSNTLSGPRGIDDIGFHMLDKDRPLALLREEMYVPPHEFAELEGHYAATADSHLTIKREGDRIFVRGPTGKPARLFAERRDAWFLKVADIQFTVVRADSGRVIGLSMNQGGRRICLDRVSDEHGRVSSRPPRNSA